jgi:hypothetical protein
VPRPVHSTLLSRVHLAVCELLLHVQSASLSLEHLAYPRWAEPV